MKRIGAAARGKGQLGCLIWLGVLLVVGHVLWKVVPVKVRSSTFLDAMQEQAAFGSIKSTQAIEYEVLRRAEELRIPVTKENLKVTRTRNSVIVEAHYQIVVELFGGAYKYVWKFDPVVERPTFAV